MKIPYFLYIFALIISALALAPAAGVAANVAVEGSALQVIELEPEKSSGLDKIFVVYETDPVNLTYTASSMTVQPKWFKYSNLGGGYAEEITGVSFDGMNSSIANAASDMGYIIEEGDARYCFWIASYGAHPMVINSVDIAEDSDCDRTVLAVDGKAEAMHYYGINGRRFTINREIEINYFNLQWDDEQANFVQKEMIHSVESLDNSIVLMPPAYCSTAFSISGDRFLRDWNRPLSATSGSYQPIAVDCRTFATEEETNPDGNSNQIHGGDGLGGSAPANIFFEAKTTDAVVHTEWQMSRDSEFSNILYRINGSELDFTFRDEGTIYVRFVGSNSDGSCETYGETFTVNIGASELNCPNAFSPGASEGVNDEWKVSYRSIIDFECWIFDRYGTQLYHFTDPEGGWDGKYHGKLVSPGVYYYVIKAKGADGKNYKRSGDINIIRFKGRKGTSSTTPTE